MTSLNDAAVEAEQIVATAITKELSDYNAVTNGFQKAADLNAGRVRMHFEDLDGDTAADIAGTVLSALDATGFQIVPIEVTT